MKVIMVMVTTVNGKITKGNDPKIQKWTSREDQKWFSSLLKKNNLLVMGSETYEATRKKMKPNIKQHRLVLTRHPAKYKKETVPGELEFSNELPAQLVRRLENKCFKQMLLLGGGIINALFLKASLVDELYLTLEPKIFGKGKTLIGEENFETMLKLINLKRLNQNGTFLLKYKILR